MRHGNKMNDLETKSARLRAAVIWSLLGAIALCIMGFMAMPATASPLNQTVPNPTPTPTQAPIPQATPTSVPMTCLAARMSPKAPVPKSTQPRYLNG